MQQPIEVIAHCKTDGSMEPIRFRYETTYRRMANVSIERIVSRNLVNFADVEAFIYLCKATEGERSRMFELRYDVRSHRWALQSILY